MYYHVRAKFHSQIIPENRRFYLWVSQGMWGSKRILWYDRGLRGPGAAQEQLLFEKFWLIKSNISICIRKLKLINCENDI